MHHLLEKLAHSRMNSRALVERSQMILLMLDGLDNGAISRQLHRNRDTVRSWRKRWYDVSEYLETAEEQIRQRAITDQGVNVDKELMALLAPVLRDLARPGVPATFTPEQYTMIIAVACEDPQASGVPLSQWSAADLAHEVVKRGIVEHISPRTIGRFFKRSGYQTASEPLLVEHN